MGETLNIAYKNEEQLLESLQKLPVEKLLEAQERLSNVIIEMIHKLQRLK